MVLGALVVIYLAVAGYWTAALLCLLLGLTGWVAVRKVLRDKEEGTSYAIFPMILIGMALLVALGVEFVRAKDDIGRMNTLFKYYLEVWILFAIASACILWYLGSRGIFRLRGMSIYRGAWLTMLALLLASGFIYPILGTRARLSNRFDTQSVTLDGADYMTRAVHWDEDQPIELRWDYDAIIWLQDHVRGSPVVLEAHNEQYHWSSRIANYTGLPTVLGWPWHQIQQRMRYDHAVRDRISDVEEMYSTSDVGRDTGVAEAVRGGIRGGGAAGARLLSPAGAWEVRRDGRGRPGEGRIRERRRTDLPGLVVELAVLQRAC